LIRNFGAALVSFAVSFAVASSFVLLLTTLLSLRIADVVVAFAPGAQDTMMVLALALHLDPIFIGVHHLCRFLLVSLSIPLLAKWLGPPPSKPEARPAERPTIED